MRSLLLAVLGIGVLAASQPVAAQQPTTPAAHLGRPVGGDFTLADWSEVSSYFKRLDAESPRVLTRKEGVTAEGREFLISIISSETNLARLDEIKAHARTLADPRGKTDAQIDAAVRDGRVIIFISCAMHANETASPQWAMEFAHALATSDDEPWKSARERLVVVIFPTTNPDGLDIVTEWYRKTVGTPYEATDLLRLYQLYSGHDNNRDWFMLTQAETRIVTRLLYTEWFPTVYWDVHQQGSEGERMFVPPFRDPLNPNLDPGVIAGINLLGTRAVLDMTRAGLTGISTGVSYDMWWNGGNRNVPVRHNIVGLLTEAASVQFATPIFLQPTRVKGPDGLYGNLPSNQHLNPWPGGWWRLRDIIDYEHAFGRSLLASLSREPELWRRTTLHASLASIRAGAEESPRGWIIPSDNRDPDAVKRLAEALILSGIELSVCDAPITADGRTYPAGSIVIRRDQPYGQHAKDLFDVQRYPDGSPPYDVAGWTLPLLMGVRRVEVMHEMPGACARVNSAELAVRAFTGDARAAGGAISTQHGDAWTRLAEGLAAGKAFDWKTTGDQAGLLVPCDPGAPGSLTKLPRVGLYSPWSGSMDEGWMRYVLETQRIPYVTMRNEMIRAGKLADVVDVLIIPSIGAGTLDRGRADGSVPDPYAGGLAPEGAVAVEEFVREGGTLITFASASAWAITLFKAPLVDVTGEPAGKDFSCPGSVLRAVPEGLAPCAGLPPSVHLFFSRGAAYREMTNDERNKTGSTNAKPDVLLRYAPTRLLQSGWVARPEVIEGQAAWVCVPHGKGRVHLFGFQPHFRAWTHGTFQLIHRATFLRWR
ncbi:MAG: peptidase [Phycisphaerae bacterium]|nr:MAG: peptidase [Phycisphaerae bacterium]